MVKTKKEREGKRSRPPFCSMMIWHSTGGVLLFFHVRESCTCGVSMYCWYRGNTARIGPASEEIGEVRLLYQTGGKARQELRNIYCVSDCESVSPVTLQPGTQYEVDLHGRIARLTLSET
ncbi:UNVERIFIED_CONTAM: hypothetical protein K2H54_051652 [Gekko kuhli]